MPFMSPPDHRYHQAPEAPVPDLVKHGWKLDVHPYDKSREAISQPPLAIEGNNATIQSQPAPVRRVGRPRKADDGVTI